MVLFETGAFPSLETLFTLGTVAGFQRSCRLAGTHDGPNLPCWSSGICEQDSRRATRIDSSNAGEAVDVACNATSWNRGDAIRARPDLD